MAENNRTVGKQMNIRANADDMKRIEAIKKKEGLKTDVDAIRYALMLEEENANLHEVLLSHKEQIQKMNEKLENMAWRQNATYLLLLKVAKANGVVED